MKKQGAVIVSDDMPNFADIAEEFPFVRWRLLAELGHRAARNLYSKHLKGYLKTRTFSSTGSPMYGYRRGVSYSLRKEGKMVTIRSFPMNVYRSGPGSRTAKRTIGKGIFRSFESSFNAVAEASDILDRLLKEKDGVFSECEEMFKSSMSKRRRGL